MLCDTNSKHLERRRHQESRTGDTRQLRVRKPYCSGCIKVAMVICQQILSIFGADDFFALVPRSGFGAANFAGFARSCLVLLRLHCNGCIKLPRCCGCLRNAFVLSSCVANRIGVAASRSDQKFFCVKRCSVTQNFCV